MDETGDIRHIEGEHPRRAMTLLIPASVADIAVADVRRDGSDVVFEVRWEEGEMVNAAATPNTAARGCAT